MIYRWVVERADGGLEDVGAASFVLRDGCLLFYSDSECAPWHLTVGYAAGQWATVCEGDE